MRAVHAITRDAAKVSVQQIVVLPMLQASTPLQGRRCHTIHASYWPNISIAHLIHHLGNRSTAAISQPTVYLTLLALLCPFHTYARTLRIEADRVRTKFCVESTEIVGYGIWSKLADRVWIQYGCSCRWTNLPKFPADCSG